MKMTSVAFALIKKICSCSVALCAVSSILLIPGAAHAQTAYAVSEQGFLYRFDVNNPAAVTTIGVIAGAGGLEGIDFNPADGQLYGFNFGPSESSLYTINLDTAAATLVGSFSTMGVGYDLSGSTGFGFDINPKTLQPDGSIRIRLVSTNGTDLRLNSATGQVSNVDPLLNFASGSGIPAVAGAAYSNNFAELASAGGVTTLYDIEVVNDALYIQNPPNNGTLNFVGNLGINVTGNTTGFDIFTGPDGTNTAYLSEFIPGGAARSQLFSVNLDTGMVTSLGEIGASFIVRDIAIQPIPEPMSAFALLGCLAVCGLRRRRV